MEMQGVPVTLSNIESTVKKGLNEKVNEEKVPPAKLSCSHSVRWPILNALAGVLGPVLKVFVDVQGRHWFGVFPDWPIDDHQSDLCLCHHPWFNQCT